MRVMWKILEPMKKSIFDELLGHGGARMLQLVK